MREVPKKYGRRQSLTFENGSWILDLDISFVWYVVAFNILKRLDIVLQLEVIHDKLNRRRKCLQLERVCH